MYITAFFTNGAVPATGLSPTIRVRDVSDNSLAITDAAMAEVGDGWYKYDFAGYDPAREYAIRCDGGAGLTDTERYVVAGNDAADVSAIQAKTDAMDWTDIDFLVHIEGGKWEIVEGPPPQMIFYDATGAAEVARFNLFDASGNPSTSNVYKRERV